ncbi:hypothetical protein ABT282_32780 [Streptomyces sp. NPDC000927]|uniref:hypothetical protein n=1 Tax=Streptomyces sp. NPDC000927 TaxID=3154371 RepID=UPI00332BCBF1
MIARQAADSVAPAAADTLALGDTIRFRGGRWVVTAFHGPRLFLDAAEPAEPAEPGEPVEPLIILQTAVTSAPDFAVLNRAAPRSTLPARIGEFHALPRDVRKAAEKWERHVKEVLHQQAPNVPASTPPKPAFDPRLRTLRQRYRAKADQLTQAGVPVSVATVERKCAAWRKDGLMGLVDKRHLRSTAPHGRVDPRVVDIRQEVVQAPACAAGGCGAGRCGAWGGVRAGLCGGGRGRTGGSGGRSGHGVCIGSLVVMRGVIWSGGGWWGGMR